MSRARVLVASLLAALTAATFVVVSMTGTPASAVVCPPTTLTRTGPQTAAVYQNNTGGTWDLTGAVWSNAPVPLYAPIQSDSWQAGCILGGDIDGNTNRASTRDCIFDGAGGCTEYSGNGYDLTFPTTQGYAYITDSKVSDIEDAYDPDGRNRASMYTVDHGHAEFIRDDCLEAEGPSGDRTRRPVSVTIKNSLFDGCFTAFAERPPGASTAQNGTGANTFTVEDSLVYVNSQPLGPNYCSTGQVTQGRCRTTGTPGVWEGAYGIWKWSNEAASTVTVRNTVFRLDIASYSSCQAQKWPAGTYENVTLVWTGPGSYSTAGGCSNVLPAGVTLTTDVSVWNNAKAAWLAGPTPEPTPTPTPQACYYHPHSEVAGGTSFTKIPHGCAPTDPTPGTCYTHNHWEQVAGVWTQYAKYPHNC